MILTLDTPLSLSGHQLDKLREGCFYLAGCSQPIAQADGQGYELVLPPCASRAEVIKVTGFQMPELPMNFAELFSGGMGGWSAAAEHVPTVFQPRAALDNNLQACQCYAQNHQAKIVFNVQQYEQQPDTLPVFCLDVADWQWVRVGLDHDIHFLTGSFPCQPWSSMAHRGRTSVPAGKTLLELLQFVRVAQPVALLLENVAGFRSHKEFQEFLAAVEMAGYEMAFFNGA